MSFPQRKPKEPVQQYPKEFTYSLSATTITITSTRLSLKHPIHMKERCSKKRRGEWKLSENRNRRYGNYCDKLEKQSSESMVQCLVCITMLSDSLLKSTSSFQGWRVLVIKPLTLCPKVGLQKEQAVFALLMIPHVQNAGGRLLHQLHGVIHSRIACLDRSTAVNAQRSSCHMSACAYSPSATPSTRLSLKHPI